MEWKSISMHDRLQLLKERRLTNPEYTYFNLRDEYSEGKDPYDYYPASYTPIDVTDNVNYNKMLMNQITPMTSVYKAEPTVTPAPLKKVDINNNIKPLEADNINYTNNDLTWKPTTYNNSRYNPSNNIRRQIIGWEQSSMKTNAPISVKAKELTKYYLKDLVNYLSPSQLDSLTSYYYNIRPISFTPTLRQLNRLRTVHSKQEYDDILNDVANSIKVGYYDKNNPGLRPRRDRERYIFLHGYK